MTNSIRKGKAFERHVAALLRRYGFKARRSQQYAGTHGDADLVTDLGFHVECKHYRKVTRSMLFAWADRAQQDARAAGQREWVVFWRENSRPIRALSSSGFLIDHSVFWNWSETGRTIFDYLASDLLAHLKAKRDEAAT